MRELVFLGLGLLLMMALLATLAQRLRVPTPIFLVLGGLLVSMIPGVPRITIEPDLIFLVFLPPLLYEAAWLSSWRELWRWRRIVLVLAFGLVVLTATAVAYTAYWFIPGFTLALGFVLGGIVSPPDAVAATSVLKSVNAPTEQALLSDYQDALVDLHRVKHTELNHLRQQGDLDDEVLRKVQQQLDLEEEKYDPSTQ